MKLQSKTRDNKDFCILYENDNFLVATRKDYLKNYQTYYIVDQKILNEDFVIPIIKTGYVKDAINFNFKAIVDTLPVLKLIDSRDKGFYCSQCRKFSKKKMMGFEEEIVITEDRNVRQIVKSHYDGCKGWD